MSMRTSKIAHEYPFGCPREVGERFEVAPQEVDVMLRLGRIEPEPGEFGYIEPTDQAAERTEYKTRDMTASKRQRKAA